MGLCRDHFRASRCLEIDFDQGIYTELSNGYEWHVDDKTRDIVCGTWKERQGKSSSIDKCELDKILVTRVSKLFRPSFVKNPAFEKMSDAEYQSDCPPT